MAAVQFTIPYDIMVKPGNLGTPGGTVNFYLSGGLARTPAYASSALTTQLSNPVVADGAGRLPAIYLDNAISYRIRAFDKNGGLLIDRDPYIPGVAPDAAALAPYQAAAEAAALASAFSASEADLSENGAAISAVGAATSAAAAATSASAASISATGSAASATASATSAALSSSSAAAIAAAIAAGALNNATVAASTRAVLAGLNTAVGLPAYFDGSNWEHVAYSSVSAKVTADTTQGMYVRSTYDTARAWVRSAPLGIIMADWFGFTKGNAAGVNATANNAVWTALHATLVARGDAAEGVATFQGVETVRFGLGWYEFSAPLDSTGGEGLIEGLNAPRANHGFSTYLKFYNSHGFRTQRSDTSGDSTVDGVSHQSGFSTFRNIAIGGNYTGTEAEYHGIFARAPFLSDNVYIEKFAGDGYHIAGSANGADGASPPRGSPNGWMVLGGYVDSCRSGFAVIGNDTNAGAAYNTVVNNNRYRGVDEQSFLGNKYDNLQFGLNGLVTGSSTPSVVFQTNGFYGCIPGQEVGASTNAPAGDGTDNTWWYFIGAAGAAVATKPQWVSGTTYRAGCTVCCKGSGNDSQFIHCYVETSSFPGKFLTDGNSPAMVMGGGLANWVRQVHGRPASASGAGKVFKIEPCVSIPGTTASGATSEMRFGDQDQNVRATDSVVYYINHSSLISGTYRLKVDETRGVLALNYANSATFQLNGYVISTPGGTQQFGTGSNLAHVFVAPQLAICDVAGNISNSRRVWMDTAAPAAGAHAQGEIVWNRSAAVGSPKGWVCTVAGTPGTWVSLGNL